MGWEKRKSKMYFYQHQRLPDGRKAKVYFGNGFDAHMAANFLTLKKAARQIQAEALSQMQAETQEADELLNSYSKRVSELLTTEMLNSGFHNPRSRGWRMIMKTESSVATECAETSTAAASKKPRRSKGDKSTRERTAKPISGQAPRQKHSSRSHSYGHAAGISKEEAQQFHSELYENFRRESAAKQADKSGDAGNPDNPSEPTKPVEKMSVDELTEEAKRGNTDAMDRLRPIMRKDIQHYQKIGNGGAEALIRWGEVLCGKDLYQHECVGMRIATLRAQHLKEGDSPIEQLLVEEVLLCSLRQSYWTQNEPSLIQNCVSAKGLKFSIEQTQQSQRMYLKALGKLQDYRNVKARLPSLARQDETEDA